MAIIRTATPQLYVSSWCCVILVVLTVGEQARLLSNILLLRLNIASL